MTETEQDIPFEEPEPGPAEAETAAEDDDADTQTPAETPAEDAEPDEDDAELNATIEREHDLAAQRQEEAQSIEAQQRDQDAKAKKLGQVASHTAKRYHDILGDELDGFVICPLCAPWFPGIRLPVMPDYETVSAVKVAIGEDPNPPLTNDHYSRECDSCAGLGKVLTGSKVQGQTTAQCIPCKGRGWIAIGPEREQGAITTAAAAIGNVDNGAPLPIGDDPPEVAALKGLGYIVVPPMTSPEIIAAQGG